MALSARVRLAALWVDFRDPTLSHRLCVRRQPCRHCGGRILRRLLFCPAPVCTHSDLVESQCDRTASPPRAWLAASETVLGRTVFFGQPSPSLYAKIRATRVMNAA